MDQDDPALDHGLKVRRAAGSSQVGPTALIQSRGAETSGAEPSATVMHHVVDACRGSADLVLRALTPRLHGVVSRAQLLEAGMSRVRIDNWVRRGRLERLLPGIYRCTLVEASSWTRAAAAVLAACGSRGVPDGSERIEVAVSHRMAGVLRSYLPPEAMAGYLVAVSGRPIRRTPGVHVHQTPLGAGDAVLIRGLPVTSPARTILDLAGEVTRGELEQALAVAERQARHVRRDLEALLVARRYHPGSGVLRRLLSALAASGTHPLYLRSRAEAAALELIRELGLPLPLANHRAQGLEVDFLWPDLRLVLEVDGFAYHGSPEAFHRDRERDRVLAAAGYQVLRFTWQQLHHDKVRTAGALAAAIARREEMVRRS
jgi:hypothetical protein